MTVKPWMLRSASLTDPAVSDLPVTDLGAAFAALAAPPAQLEGEDPAEPRHSHAMPSDEPVQWAVVVELRDIASDRISAACDAWYAERGEPIPADDKRLMGRSTIRTVIREYAHQLSRNGETIWSLETESRYAKAVEDSIFGYGRMQPLFDITDAENIEINGHDQVTIQYGDGRRESHPPVAESDADLVEAIRFLGATANPARPFDDAHPTMTLALGDRFRLHAIGFGLSHRPSVVIRRHTLTSITLDELVDLELMPPSLAQMLKDAVIAKKSIAVSGDQGAGKTVLLRALIDAIPVTERIGTIETDYELLTHLDSRRPHVLAMQARIGLGEYRDGRRIGEYTVADLIPEALRQNLTRIIIGEVRGDEAAAMFEAMQSGAGTMSTTHSHSASSTLDRLAWRVARGGNMTIDEAYAQIALNLDFVVHVTLVDDTWRGGTRRRYISEVRELTGGIENQRPVTHLVYSNDGHSASTVQPSVAFQSDVFTKGIRS